MENEKLNEWTNGKFIARTAGTAFQYLHDINIQIYRPLLTKKKYLSFCFLALFTIVGPKEPLPLFPL